jgi:hypothetical protein
MDREQKGNRHDSAKAPYLHLSGFPHRRLLPNGLIVERLHTSASCIVGMTMLSSCIWVVDN